MFVHFLGLLVEKLNLFLIDDFGMYFSFVCLNSGMFAHGHVDVKYAHYGLDFYPGDANHTVGSFPKLLRDLVSQPLLAPLDHLPTFDSSKGYESLTLHIPPC